MNIKKNILDLITNKLQQPVRQEIYLKELLTHFLRPCWHNFLVPPSCLAHFLPSSEN